MGNGREGGGGGTRSDPELSSVLSETVRQSECRGSGRCSAGACWNEGGSECTVGDTGRGNSREGGGGGAAFEPLSCAAPVAGGARAWRRRWGAGAFISRGGELGEADGLAQDPGRDTRACPISTG